MPSRSLQTWRTIRCQALDEIEYAHRGVASSRRGSKFATQQVNYAFVMLLASQFQGFCRELHSECVDRYVQSILPKTRSLACREALVRLRVLDRGNANPSSIGADFGVFGFRFWAKVTTLDARNAARQTGLEELNLWRNAIAHQDFDSAKLGASTLTVRQVREWRNVCDRLAHAFDEVMRRFLAAELGASPW
jgi:hypothetical protein